MQRGQNRHRLSSTPLDADIDELDALRGALDSMHGGWSGTLDGLAGFAERLAMER
jgi:hypothetical protein